MILGESLLKSVKPLGGIAKMKIKGFQEQFDSSQLMKCGGNKSRMFFTQVAMNARFGIEDNSDLVRNLMNTFPNAPDLNTDFAWEDGHI